MLYGGSAGGGKSYAILADPLRYITHPQFSGLVLRHTTEELRELIWKSQELYPKIIPNIVWSERKMQWSVPNGGRLWMSYLDRDEDVLRYQGLSFCVAEGTQVLMADNTYKAIELINTGDKVATLEGPQKITYRSQTLFKKCVKVSVFSSEGHLLAEQIQPYSHPIAVLSEEPSLSLSGLCQTVEQFRQSPLLWRSYTHLQSFLQESRETSSFLTSGQNYNTAYVSDTPENQQLQPLFYPVVLHEQGLQLALARDSKQCCVHDKSLLQLLDLYREISKTLKDQPLLSEHFQLHLDRSKLLLCHTCGGVSDAPLVLQTIKDFLIRCFSYSHLYDELLLSDLEAYLDAVQKLSDAVKQNHDCHYSGDKGCIPLYTRYQQREYVHPYTKEQRELKDHTVLGIVKIETLENPLMCVRDVTVDNSNHYITFGGVVNKNCYIAWDELTQWPTSFAYDYMRSRLRTTAPDLPIYIRATTNPGNKGHAWVKKAFIDPAPPGKAFYATNIETGETLVYPAGHALEGQPLFKRRFIPASLSDNPYLAKTGEYEAMLLSLPEHQRKQLLEGSWDVAEGAAFPEFNRNIHVVEPFSIPHDWSRFRACDYGYGSWTAVLWFAVAPDESIYVYRELYVTKVLAEDLATQVLALEANDKIRYGVLDSSCWHRRGDTGPSIAERMIMRGCRWKPSDRSAGSRVAGKNEIHRRLQVDSFTGEPRIKIFNTCTQLIADLPSLPLDKKTLEDVDTTVKNDHSYDALRYGLMSRPRSSNLFDFSPAKSYSVTPADPVFGY